MKLILMRHAKSSWDDKAGKDFDRPLAPRGLRDAPVIAADMRRRKLQPSLLLVSAAQRTRETLALLVQTFAHDAIIHIDASLYSGDAHAYIDTVERLAGNHDQVLLLGHNPTIQDTAIAYCESHGSGDLQRMQTKFPTAAYAAIDFGASGPYLAPAIWNALLNHAA